MSIENILKSKKHGGYRQNSGRKKSSKRIAHDWIVSNEVAEVQKSFEMLVELRDRPDTETRDKIACIKEILDRVMGKPSQFVNLKQENKIDDTQLQIIREDVTKFLEYLKTK